MLNDNMKLLPFDTSRVDQGSGVEVGVREVSKQWPRNSPLPFFPKTLGERGRQTSEETERQTENIY